MSASDSLVKSSFFDDIYEDSEIDTAATTSSTNISKKVSGMWVKLKNFNQNELQEKFMYFCDEVLNEGKLMKKSKKHKKLKHKYFVLYKDRLEQYDDEFKKPQNRKGFMPLNGVKIEILDNTNDDKLKSTYQKYCLIFTHNKSFFILYALSWDLCESWYHNLKKCCVLNYFAKNFTNLKMIGKGSFAKVLLSKRNSDQKEFAVKTFDKKLVALKSKRGLINEITLMRILDHPNIITLYEIYEGDYHIYLVCELLKGGELFERIIKNGHYSEKDACLIIAQLLNALEYIHMKGVMHRDIKPENLILKNEEGFDVKLADFGLADFVNRKNLFYKRCGTPGYVAPEILNDEDYDTKVDIFSTGVILYIMLTGTSPFYGKTYNEILMKNKKCEIGFDFSFLQYKISEDACDLLKKMLQKDPRERISASEAMRHPWINTYTDIYEEHGTNESSTKSENIITPSLKECFENMKTSYIKQTKIETSLDYDITMSTPVMNGRTLQLPITNENPFNSPAFTLTPKMNIGQMGRNEEVNNALQSLKGMMGINGSVNIDRKDKPANVSKCDLHMENERTFGQMAAQNPTNSEFLRRRTLNLGDPNEPGSDSFHKTAMMLLPYHNKIVKPKSTSNSTSTSNLQKLEAMEIKPKFEESKASLMNEPPKATPKKEEGKVLNIKSKLKNLE